MPDINLKFKADIDTEAVVKKINVLLQNLKTSLGSFGSDIQLLDTNKIKQDIDGIDRELESIKNNTTKIKQGVDGLADGLSKASNQGNLLARTFQFNQFAQAISYVTGALNQFTAPFVELDKQVKNVGTLGVKNFSEFSDAAIQLSKSVPDSAGAIAEGIYDAISAGTLQVTDGLADIDSGMKFVETASKLAVGGMTNTKDAINGLTSVMNAYGIEAGDAEKVSDIFFGAVNLGKTTIQELNSSLYNVIPTASAFGVSFDQIAASIATMTKQGTPTRQATTQLRQALVELAKPGAKLAPIMEKAGVSLDSLKKEGLQVSLQKIGQTIEGMGLSATQVFSSVEASSAVMLLTGKSASMAMSDWEGVKNSVGSTQYAFDTAAGSIEVKTKILLNKVQAMFSGAFDALGTGAMTTLNVLNQLSPAILSFAGIKQIIPPGALTNLKNLPQMFNNILPAVQRLSTGIVTLIPGFTAVGATGVATGTATASAWMAALAPILLIIAAIGLIVGAFVLLYKNVEGFRNTIDAIFTVVVYSFERMWEVLQRVGGIIVALGGAVLDYLAVPFKVLWEVATGVIEAIFGVGDSASAAEEHMKLLDLVFAALLKTLTYVEAALKGVQAYISSVTGSIVNVVNKVLKGDFLGAMEEMGKAGENAGKAFMEGFNNTVSENAVNDAVENMNRQVEGGLKLKAKMEIDSEILVNEYAKLQQDIQKLKIFGVTDKDKNDLALLEGKAKSLAEQIGKVLPETRQNVQLIADSNGKLVESYDININKAMELSSTHKDLYDSKLTEAQTRYGDDLKVIADEYDKHKNKLEEIQQKANEAAKSGNKEEVRKLTKEYEEQSKKVNEIGQNLLKSYGEGAKAGLVNEQMQKRITTQLNISADVNQKIKEGQIDLNSAVGDTEDSVKSLGDAFQESMSKAKESQQDAIGSLAQLKIKLKDGKISQQEYEKDRKKYLDDGIKATKELKEYTEAQKEAEQDIGINQKKTTSSRKTNSDFADKEYQATKKRIDLEAKSKEITIERERIESGREKNTSDEIISNEIKLQSLKDQLQALEKIYKLSKNEKGDFKVGIDLKGTSEEIKGKVDKVVDEAINLTNSIAEQENKQIEIKLKASLDEKKTAQELKEKNQQLDKSELEFKIKMGFAKPQEMLALLESQLAELQDEINDKAAKGDRTAKEEQEYIELQNKALSLRNEIADKKKDINDRELRDLQEKNQRELDLIEQTIEAQRRLTDILIGATESTFTKNITAQKEKELKKIEELKEAEVLTEEEAEKRKEELELQHQKKIANIQAAARGEQLEAERQLTLQLLREQEKRLVSEIDLLDPQKDAEQYNSLITKLGDLQGQIEEKGDLIQAYSLELQSGITETFQNLFTGDAESMKAPFRSMMATLAGVLKQVASAVITKLVLDQLALTPGGFLALAAVPAIKGIVGGAVNVILGPILDKLLSFAYGGRIDEPTLAIIGDKTRAGGSTNREWVLWDEHITMIIGKALGQYQQLLMKHMVGDLAVDKFNETAVVPLYMEIRKLSNSIDSLKPYLSKLSVSDIVDIISEKNAINDLEKRFYSDLISYDQYAQETAVKELRIRSLASGGFAYKPEIVQIGDAGINNPEIVLNSPQLANLIAATTSSANKKLEKKIDELINAVYETKDIYLDHRKVTDEVVREMNRRRR